MNSSKNYLEEESKKNISEKVDEESTKEKVLGEEELYYEDFDEEEDEEEEDDDDEYSWEMFIGVICSLGAVFATGLVRKILALWSKPVCNFFFVSGP